MKRKLTKDGKYQFDGGLSLIDLRNACKMNGIKGYSKCDKLEMVKLLLKV